MINVIPYTRLHVSKHDWLESRFHFSFSEYHNPDGFEMHHHRDMEIFTYVLEGELSHEDSMGHKETLYAGDIQYLSAGTGIYHSEKNEIDKALGQMIACFGDGNCFVACRSNLQKVFNSRSDRFSHSVNQPHLFHFQ